MKSPLVLFLSGILGAVLVVCVFFYCGGFAYLVDEHPVTATVFSEEASPDGMYIAIAERKTNNHGWCEERTTVDPLGESSDWGREHIFNVDCGSQVEMNWVGNRNLTISYSYDDTGNVRTYKEFFSKDKRVTISYFLRQ